MSKELLKGSAFLAGAELIAKMKGLIVMPLLTRHFGTLDYGVWSQVLAITLTFSPLVILGTDQALIRFVSGKEKESQKTALSTLILFLMGMICLMGGFIYIAEQQIVTLFLGTPSPEYLEMVPLAILFMAIGIFLSQMTNWLLIQGEVRLFATTTVLQAALGVSAIAALLFMKGGVLEFVILSICAEAILLVSLLIRHTLVHGWSKPDFSVLPHFLKYGLPLLPAAYAMWGLNWVDRLFLVQYSNLEEIGIYSLVYGLGLIVIPMLARPFWAMFPAKATSLYNQEKIDELQKNFDFSAGAMALLIIPAIVGLYLISDLLILSIATPAFIGGASIIALIAAGYALENFSSFYDVSLGLAYRQVWSSISLVAAVVTNILLNALWVPEYGIQGAAWATLCAFICKFLISYIAAKPFCPYKTKWSYLLRIFLSSTLMACALILAKEQLLKTGLSSWQELLVLSLLGIVVYSISVILMWRAAFHYAITYAKNIKWLSRE